MRAQSRYIRKLDIDFSVLPDMCADMEDDHERSREAAIEQLLLSAGYLMEEASPELAMRIEPTRHALEVRIRLVEDTATDLLSLASAARAVLKQVHS